MLRQAIVNAETREVVMWITSEMTGADVYEILLNHPEYDADLVEV